MQLADTEIVWKLREKSTAFLCPFRQIQDPEELSEFVFSQGREGEVGTSQGVRSTKRDLSHFLWKYLKPFQDSSQQEKMPLGWVRTAVFLDSGGGRGSKFKEKPAVHTEFCVASHAARQDVCSQNPICKWKTVARGYFLQPHQEKINCCISAIKISFKKQLILS